MQLVTKADTAETIIDATRSHMWQRKPLTDSEKLDRKIARIERENEQTVKWDHRIAKLGVATIAVAALFGMASSSVVDLITGKIDARSIILLVSALIGVIVMNRSLLSSARNMRRAETRDEAVAPIDRIKTYTIMSIEALSFGYMLWIFEHPSNFVVWALLIARAAAIPYTAVDLELQREMALDIVDMNVISQIGQGIGLMRDQVRKSYDHNVPSLLKIENYRAVAHMSTKLEGMFDRLAGASRTYDHWQAHGEVKLLDRHGNPLAMSGQTVTIETPQEGAKPTILQRFTAKAKGKIQPSKRASTDSNREAIVSELVERLRAGDKITNPSVSKEYTLSTSTASAYINQAKAIVATSKPQAKPIHPPIVDSTNSEGEHHD